MGCAASTVRRPEPAVAERPDAIISGGLPASSLQAARAADGKGRPIRSATDHGNINQQHHTAASTKSSDDPVTSKAAESLPCSGDVTEPSPAVPAALCQEHERLQALLALGMVGADPEPRFDSITGLMKAIFDTPVCALTLVTEATIYMHSRAGQWACQAPRRGSFCEWILSDPDACPRMLIVEDALVDGRFAANRYVTGPPNVRFYAGCPLIGSGGHVFGALCILDFTPRAFAPDQYLLLCHFAELATRELERDKSNGPLATMRAESIATCRRIMRALDAAQEAVAMVDVSRPEWALVYANEGWAAVTGTPGSASGRDDEIGQAGATFWDLYGGRAVDPVQVGAAFQAVQAGQPFTLSVHSRTQAGGGHTVRFKPAGWEGQLGQAVMPLVAVPAGTFLDKTAAATGHEDQDRAAVPLLARIPAASPALSADKAAALSAALAAATGATAAVGSSMASISSVAGAAVAFTEAAADRETLCGLKPAYYIAVMCAQQAAEAQPAPAGSASGLEPQQVAGQRRCPMVPPPSSGSAAPAGAFGSHNHSTGPRLPDATSHLFPLTPGANPFGVVLAAAAAAGSRPARSELHPTSLRDVILGPMVGVGPRGRCYRALWRGTKVAVKVVDFVDWERLPSDEGISRGGSSAAAKFAGSIGVPTPAARTASSDDSSNGSARTSGTGSAWSSDAGPALAAAEACSCLKGGMGSLGQRLDKVPQHPHLVPTYSVDVAAKDVGQQGSAGSKVLYQVWIVQKFCAGGALADALERGALRLPSGGSDLAAALLTAAEVAGAMACLHSRAILHGALTSDNVMLCTATSPLGCDPLDTRGWGAHVGDYGFARRSAPGGGAKAALCAAHLPPEVLLGGEPSLEAEVFAFGVLLWEMWCGRRAWRGLGSTQVLHAVALEGCSLPLPAGAPPELKDLMRRCLHYDVRVRPTFKAICKDLEAQVGALRGGAARS